MTLGDVLSSLRLRAQAVSAASQAVSTTSTQIEADLRKIVGLPEPQATMVRRAADLAHALSDLGGALGSFADETAKALDGLTRS